MGRPASRSPSATKAARAARLEQADAVAREQQMGERTVAGRDLARTRGLLSR